jgi:hypothetical protein
MKKSAVSFLLLSFLALPVGASVEPGDARIYTHRAVNGDTLLKLANRFLIRKTDWAALQKNNTIADPNRIPVGTAIRIPVALMRTELVPATIESSRGRVESSAGQVAPGTTLKEGDQLKTGDDGFVTIKLADGSTLTVQSKSAVKLEVMRQLANTGGVADSVVRLDSGRLETNVAKQRGPAARYEIRTPTSNMGVRGTAFRAGADETGKKGQSEVVEGLVAVAGSGAGRALDLPAGYGSIVEAGKPPSPPIELLPAPDLKALQPMFTSADPSFSFAPVAGATSYRTQVAADRAFTNLIAEVATATPTAKYKDLSDGELFFRARAIDAQGLEGKDAIHSFVVKARPFAPSLETPLSNARLSTGRVTMSWKPNADARAEVRAYRLQLARDSEFKQMVEEKTLPGLSLSPAGALASGNYVWRVASLDAAGGVGPWSEAKAFVVAAEKPVLKPKRGGKAIVLELDGTGSRQYQVQVSRNDKFTNLVSDRVVSSAELNLSGLSPNVYYVRIRVVTAAASGGAEVAGEWSETGTLEVYVNDWWLSTYHAPAR